MKRKNKIKRFAPKFAGHHIKIGDKCRDCEYSDESTLTSVKLRCTYHKPKVIFHPKVGWVCFSFSQKMLSNNDEEGGKQY